MKSKQLLFWQIAFSYIGAIIGAGFASGQEIVRFFGKFGLWGVAGGILAGLLLAYFGYSIVTTAATFSFNSYEQYLVFLFGPSKAKLFDGIISLFLLSGLGIMLVAGGSLFHQLWGWKPEVGFILNALLLYGLMLVGVKGMLWLNTLLMPGLLVVSLLVTTGGIMEGGEVLTSQHFSSGLLINNWFCAALLYVSYNVVLGMVVLVTLGGTIRQGGSGGVIMGGVTLGVMAAFLSLALSMNTAVIEGQDLPLLALAEAQSPWLKESYSFVLWVAIISTALANGMGLSGRLEQLTLGPKPLVVALPLLPALFLLRWSLGRAIGVFYPLMGYLGLILIAGIIFSSKPGKKVFH